MTKDRYNALMADERLDLTAEEVAEGWHFCWDWDLLLIHENDREAEVCTCQK